MDLAPVADRPACDDVLAELQTVPFPIPPQASPADGWARDPNGTELLEVARIVADPQQPRKMRNPDELIRLGDSVARRGVLQPLRVQWLADLGLWMLVAGERRLSAAQAAGLTAVPAVRASGSLTEAEALEEQLAENLLRDALNPIDEANAYRRLMVLRGYSQTALAGECNLSRGTVYRSLQLLELDGQVQALVAAGQVKVSSALELVGLPAERQIATAQRLAGSARAPAETRGAQIGRAPLARLKVPRTTIRADPCRVVVYGPGDVAVALRAALRTWGREQRPRAAA